MHEALVQQGDRSGKRKGPELSSQVDLLETFAGAAFDAVLFDGGAAALRKLDEDLARRSGSMIPIHVADPAASYPMDWLVLEQSISTNSTAAGGNATLMMIG